MVGYIPRWFTCPQTVTHSCSNRARRRATLLIETNALPLAPNGKVNEEKGANPEEMKNAEGGLRFSWRQQRMTELNGNKCKAFAETDKRCGSFNLRSNLLIL